MIKRLFALVLSAAVLASGASAAAAPWYQEALDWGRAQGVSGAPLERPEALFRSRWLREQLWGLSGLLTRSGDGRRYVAAPYDAGRPFPLPALFCFARVVRIGGRMYAVFAFDKGEQPVF